MCSEIQLLAFPFSCPFPDPGYLNWEGSCCPPGEMPCSRMLFFFRGGYYGLDCTPSKTYVELITLSTSECDLIWRQGLHRGDQVKMRLSGWALSRYDRCSYEKRQFGCRNRYRRKLARRHRKKTVPSGPRRGLEHVLPCSLRRVPSFPPPWLGASGLQSCETTNSGCSNHPARGAW